MKHCKRTCERRIAQLTDRIKKSDALIADLKRQGRPTTAASKVRRGFRQQLLNWQARAKYAKAGRHGQD